jgi:hypothetical protein
MSLEPIKLPSGAILKIQVAEFAVAKALYQAVLEELKSVNVSSQSDLASIFKDLACIGLSSRKIEACLNDCFKRCTIDQGSGDLKIDKDTFEPVERRDDYLTVCVEVAKANIGPFAKSLYAEYKAFLTATTFAQS